MALTKLAVLSDARVTLRAPCEADVIGRLKLGNSPELHRLFGGEPSVVRPLTEDAAAAWVDALAREKYGWVIESEGELLGSIRLHSLNYADHRAHLAIGILDESRLGQGYGSAAMRLVAAFAFEQLKFHRLTLRVLDFNQRAIAAYRKVGFIEEGRERESACIGGKWHDDIIMGLLAPDLQMDEAS